MRREERGFVGVVCHYDGTIVTLGVFRFGAVALMLLVSSVASMQISRWWCASQGHPRLESVEEHESVAFARALRSLGAN